MLEKRCIFSKNCQIHTTFMVLCNLTFVCVVPTPEQPLLQNFAAFPNYNNCSLSSNLNFNSDTV